tara:strand:- start:749 stop:883 length:135 start_codon:yes stop_codon:yes gene_type:complete
MMFLLLKRFCIAFLLLSGIVLSGCAYDPSPQRTPDGFDPPYNYD